MTPVKRQTVALEEAGLCSKQTVHIEYRTSQRSRTDFTFDQSFNIILKTTLREFLLNEKCQQESDDFRPGMGDALRCFNSFDLTVIIRTLALATST